ncbi:Retrovirus-related Pol polyprotein from transposon TNT 1-94 [Dendrobium catenatum]|uniref:Retrovirus-related Pol polyprotein from transposon TNT 1-94 n=1 Tax=Dendrobium catenatum TaxID=906689 RepID=A0A2I0W497_9ASPA|nr:Retrovirus-related Pol polyprotein from transposon TNT 1-94 [Dendrobium catenatum]
MAESSVSSPSANSNSSISSMAIPTQLKFLMNNIKNLILTSLAADNYPLWKSQTEKVFTASGFKGFLDGTTPCPLPSATTTGLSTSGNPSALELWNLTDQHLAAALCSVITPSILPYVLDLTHCHEIWSTLAHRLQATTRSRIIQLKNDLHHLSKGDKSMTQYLLEIKSKVDAIQEMGHTIDPEDVILYTLNGLPSSYQSFKTAIRTNLQPLSLDDLYSLLCSEEQLLLQEATKDLQTMQITDNSVAFAASRGRAIGRNNTYRGNRGRRQSTPTGRGDKNPHINTTCQICSKTGHSAICCWYHNDPAYSDNSNTSALFSAPDNNRSTDWFLDSGASSHLTTDQSQLSVTEPYYGNSQVILGNGQSLPIQNTGKGLLPTPTGKLCLNKIHHVPNLSFNLLSVHQLTTDNNCVVYFSSHGYQIKDSKTHRLLLQGPCHNGLYRVPSKVRNQHLALLSAEIIPDLWHSRLGHPASPVLQQLARTNSTICTSTHNNCNTCCLAKSRRLPFTTSTSKTTALFQIVHSDVWGPSPIASIQGYRYFVSFIDDFSKYCWIFPMFQKSEVTKLFVLFHKFINCQFSINTKTIRTDGGGEYANNSFTNYCRQWGIHHQFTCPYTPQQNGVAERKNRHILEAVRSLLIHSHAPSQLWADALHTAIYLINRLPTSTLNNNTPFQQLYNHPPAYSHMKIFRCLCYPWLRPYVHSKLTPLSRPCIFIGYALNQKGYRCMDIATRKVYTSRHVVFNESVFPFQQNQFTHTTGDTHKHNFVPPLLLVPSTLLHNTQPYNRTSYNSPQPIHAEPTPEHSSSSNTNQNLSQNLLPHEIPKHPMRTRFQTGNLKPIRILDLTHQITEADPTSYSQAVKHAHLRQAMSQEFQAL